MWVGNAESLFSQNVIALSGLWRVVQGTVVTNEPPLGMLGVYVDDLLLSSEEAEANALLEAICSLWTCSPEQRSTKGRVTFCGLEIDQNPETFALEIHQASYISELESRHGSSRSVSLPMFKEEDEEEEGASLEKIREAQGLAGELTWISCRSRPDISFSVSKIARMLSRRPEAAIRAARQVIGYLLHTRAYCLHYGGPTDPELEGHLLRQRESSVVETFTDASFGVESGRSQSGVIVTSGGCVVGWLSLTQPFTTLSTCESELIAACEGLTLTQALLPLWSESLGSKPAWYAYTDSVACAAVLIYPSGNWRTKHLRLRSKVYQELVEAEELVIAHVPGRFQLADALTKALTRVRMLELLKFAGWINLEPQADRNVAGVKASAPLLKMLIASYLVGQAKAQPDQRASENLQAFGWAMFTLVVVVFGLIGLFLQGQRHKAHIQVLKDMSDRALRELERVDRVGEHENGGAVFADEHSSESATLAIPPPSLSQAAPPKAKGVATVCREIPSKSPTVAAPPPSLVPTAPPKAKHTKPNLNTVPAFDAGPCNAMPAVRPDVLLSAGRAPGKAQPSFPNPRGLDLSTPGLPKQVQPDHPNPRAFGLGPPDTAIPKQVQPDHPNPRAFGLGPPDTAIPKQVQPDHPNPRTFGLGPPDPAIPKQVQPDHPNPGTFGLGPPDPAIPKQVQPDHPNPSSFDLGPSPITVPKEAPPGHPNLETFGLGPPDPLLELRARSSASADEPGDRVVPTPPREEDELESITSDDSLESEALEHSGPDAAPYQDLTPPSNGEDWLDATLRDVLSLNGPLLMAYLGPNSPEVWAWHVASDAFLWGVHDIREDYLERFGDPQEITQGLQPSEVQGLYMLGSGPSQSQATLSVAWNAAAAAASSSSWPTLNISPVHNPILGYYLDDNMPGQPSEPSEHDIAIAQAAFFLYQNNLQFDWEQLSEEQQDVYHSLVGQWIANIHEVD